MPAAVVDDAIERGWVKVRVESTVRVESAAGDDLSDVLGHGGVL